MNVYSLIIAIFGMMLVLSNSAYAWHSRSECMKNAFAPHCEPPTMPICKSRKPCTLEHGKTINACVDWRCENHHITN